MGSSNNFYQQALHENKLLQMKILELKHKAALYEVCLGSIASILKDLPLQQNINDTRQSQNAALHKIATVLTHIESAVRSNREMPLLPHPAHNLSHNPLLQLPPKVFSWPVPGNSITGKRLYAGPPYTPIEMQQNLYHPTASPNFSHFVHGEPQSFESLGEPGYPQIHEAYDYPHVSTLSIHKCMKSTESQPHTIGAMTISPIKIPQNLPMVIRRPIPVSDTKTIFPYPPPTGAPHFIERKRILTRGSEIFDELLRKKVASTATMDSAGALDLQMKQKQNHQHHHAYKHTIEYPAANQHQKNDSTPKNGTSPHPMMSGQSGNPFLQEKRSHHQQMLNGGNIIVNMERVSNNDSNSKWNPIGPFNDNSSSKPNSRPGTAAPVSSQFQPALNQPTKSIQVNRMLHTTVASTPVGNSTKQNDEEFQSDRDCTIIN